MISHISILPAFFTTFWQKCQKSEVVYRLASRKIGRRVAKYGVFFDASQISCIERGWYSNRQRVRVYVDDLMSFVSVLGILQG
jgi:hypothetical protein